MPGSRLASGGYIDRSHVLHFTFDGCDYTGFQGDTLASALLANGVSVVARSFKLHRPRGVMSAGLEECNAVVTVGENAWYEVNARATQVPLFDGLVAHSQNCWPSARSDVGGCLDWCSRWLPAGFYHKTFLWPQWRWYERAVRTTAGLGRITGKPDPERYVKRFHHCDVLVVGAGPAGIAAALSAARTGQDVTLLDAGGVMGGSLTWDAGAVSIAGTTAVQWLATSLAKLGSAPNVGLLPRTLALGYYDDNLVTAIERINEIRAPGRDTGGTPRERLWKIRAGRVVLATGAIERPLVFADNDRPGIMLASAVREYCNRHAVAAGRRVAVFTNNDSAYSTALDLFAQGVEIAAIIDVRRSVSSGPKDRACAFGIPVHLGHAVVGTGGNKALRSLEIAELDVSGKSFVARSRRCLECDLLAVSGGWNPVVHLFSQAGGKLRYDRDLACFVPDHCHQAVQCVGAANGTFGLHECLEEGRAAGAGGDMCVPIDKSDRTSAGIEPFWRTPDCDGNDQTAKQWVDFLHDVTVSDIDLASREGFSSVEHLKRYTATGMAVDQGKTSNVNALAILGERTDRDIPQVGTTTFRPPYHPVTIGALAGTRVGRLAGRYRRLPVRWHEDHGAVMEDHSGWLRPACYVRPGETEQQAIAREARAARRQASLFDSSSLGKIEVFGHDAAEFLNRLYVNNVKTLRPGRMRYGLMLNENGIIKDDGVFGCLGENHYLVTTSSAGALDIYFWMEEWRQCEWRDLDVQLAQQTAQWATLTVSGPESREIVARLGLELDLSPQAFPHMHLRRVELDGIPLRVGRVSFGGELSFELNIGADYAEALWRRLLEAGAPRGITPLGMEALDVLRVEKGFLEVGVDTDGETCPLDVGWAAAIGKKPADFIGRRSLMREHMQRSDRLQLVGLRPVAEQLPVPVGAHTLDEAGRAIGHITSSCLSPNLNRSLALAMVRGGAARHGQLVEIDIEGRRHPAMIGAPSYYDPQGERLNA